MVEQRTNMSLNHMLAMVWSGAEGGRKNVIDRSSGPLGPTAGEILLLSGGSGWRAVVDAPRCAQSVAAVPHKQLLEGSGHCPSECEPVEDTELLVLAREVSLN